MKKRPLKFRARDFYTSEYRFAALGEIMGDLYPEMLTFVTDEAYNVDPYTVAQFVGYDSKGAEVYEGDILADENGGEYVATLQETAENQTAPRRLCNQLTLKEDVPMINPQHGLKKFVRYAGNAKPETFYLSSAYGWLATGVKDYKGNEIFEGDIINDEGDLSVVTFKDGAFWAFDQILEHFGGSVEIVGHIATEEKK